MKTNLLGCLEQKIMNILWSSSCCLKPGDVKERLEGDYAYTTIMTVLKRMSDKNLLERNLKGKVYFYSPIQNKEKFIKTNLSDIYGDLVKSYGDLAISQFVDALKSNPKELELLQNYLNNNETKK